MSRADGRGHWPRGKHRHPQSGADIASRALDAGWSVRGLAERIGVSDRTIRRWRDDEDWPGPEHRRVLSLAARRR